MIRRNHLNTLIIRSSFFLVLREKIRIVPQFRNWNPLPAALVVGFDGFGMVPGLF